MIHYNPGNEGYALKTIVVENGSNTIVCEDNTIYIFETLTELALSLSAEFSAASICHIVFTSGAVATEVTVVGIIGINSNDILANSRVEVSVMGNVGVAMSTAL